MVSHKYSPRAEQFESRILLAADLIPVFQAEHVDTVPAAIETISASNAHDSNVMLHTERVNDSTMLIVQFMDARAPRTLHIPGGDSTTTEADGSARLQLPADVRTVDLSIRELMTGEVSVIRLEFADDGQIVNQSSVAMNSSDEPDSHQDLVISPNHSSSHAPTANASLFSNTDDWTHDLPSNWDHAESLAGTHVDSAMAHESGMSTPTGTVSHGSATAGYSTRSHAAPQEDSSNAVEGAEGMAPDHPVTGGTVATVSAATLPQQAIEPPIDEDLESILANWTSDQPHGGTPGLSGNPIRPVFSEVLAISPNQPASDPTAVVLVSYVSGDETAPASDVSAVSHWPFAGGVLIAAAAVGSAAALNRRAEHLQAEATGIIHLSMD